MKPAVGVAVSKYLKSTTLHGLKYLVTPNYWDRIGWLISCAASACCAGVLCAVLWERFLNLPALLSLTQVSDQLDYEDNPATPTIAVCQPPVAIANKFLSNLINDNENKTRFALAFANAVQGKDTNKNHLYYLEVLFRSNNLDPLRVLETYSPECSHLVRKCRWHNLMVPCEQLFKKELTLRGVCCVANPARFSKVKLPAMYQMDLNGKLDLVLNCYDGARMSGCEVFTKYVAEEWITPLTLSTGHIYFAVLMSTFEIDYNDEKLLVGTCISDRGYSQRHCFLRVREEFCGCYDPLDPQRSERNTNRRLKPCRLSQIQCLKTFGKVNNSTTCLPPCKRVKTKFILESGELTNLQYTLDPLTMGINATQSSVLRLIINTYDSSMLLLIPTETWLTLLSSLGGVFSMFLGVGFISTLEILFFVFVKLPAAIRRKPDKDFSQSLRVKSYPYPN